MKSLTGCIILLKYGRESIQLTKCIRQPIYTNPIWIALGPGQGAVSQRLLFWRTYWKRAPCGASTRCMPAGRRMLRLY